MLNPEAETLKLVGVPGVGSCGVTAFDAALGGLVPMLFVAVTVNV
jgi:hypothetical protein